MNSKSSLALALTTALLLSACGGGGGGGNTASTPADTASAPTGTTPAVTLPSTALALSVPAATYAAGGDNALIFDRLNDLRGRIGSGLFTQNAQLDTAAAAHFNYIKLNGFAEMHGQTAGAAGFTGATPSARAAAANYPGNIGEVLAGMGNAGRAAECVGGWENSVYHMSVIFEPSRDVGVSAGTAQVQIDGTAADFTNCVVDFGVLATAAPQLPASDVVLVYPYSDQTGVVAAFNNQAEFPVPVADLNGVGHPVGLRFQGPVDSVSVLTITPAGGTALSARILASSQATGPGVVVDTNVGSTELFLVPTAALAASTVYTVSFTGVVGGKAVTKTWSFTTAA